MYFILKYFIEFLCILDFIIKYITSSYQLPILNNNNKIFYRNYTK